MAKRTPLELKLLKQNMNMIAVSSLIIMIAAGFFLVTRSDQDVNPNSSAASKKCDLNINPKDFSADITKNKYFNLPVGKKMVYELNTPEGLEKIEITIEKRTKMVAGVKTRVYRDKVYLDGQLIEDTRDYLAQHRNGDVWYFGEDVKNYENGKFVDNEGSWLAGKDCAKPGIWIKADPKVGDSYLQEYLKGVAEDTSDIVSVNETVKIKIGTFTNCVKTFDWTPLDDTSLEYKYYCPKVGGLVASEHLEENSDGELEAVDRTELVNVKTSSKDTDDDEDDDADED